MRVFVTGATGFIGSAVVRELLSAGHEVLGLARSEDKAEALIAAGAEAFRGSLEEPKDLQRAVADADGVIHLAFDHDFSKFAANCERDRRVIEALGTALAGTNRPLVVTSGTLVAEAEPGQPATENDRAVDASLNPRAVSENAVATVVANGGNACLVRLPQVHDPVRQGLITWAVDIYREKGMCCYVDAGLNAVPAVHVSDAARVFRLALEKAEPGARYHAVAEEGVTMKVIAEAIGQRLQLPVRSIAAQEAEAFFGWLIKMVGMMIRRPASKRASYWIGSRPGPGCSPT